MKKAKLVTLAVATSTVLGFGVGTLSPQVLNVVAPEKVEASVSTTGKWASTNITYSKGKMSASVSQAFDEAISKINALGIVHLSPAKNAGIELLQGNEGTNCNYAGTNIIHATANVSVNTSDAFKEKHAIYMILAALGLNQDTASGHTMSAVMTPANVPATIDNNATNALRALYSKKTASKPVTKAPVNVAPKSPTVTVNYKKGYGINLWADNNGLKFTGRRLMHGTSWKFTATNKANGHTYYKVGNNQWLDGKYLKVSGSVKENTAIVTPKTATKPTTKPTTSNKAKGVLTIKYIKGYGVNLWGTSEGTNFTGRRLLHGTSWKFSTKVTNAKEQTFYNVGRNQWVDGKYVVVK